MTEPLRAALFLAAAEGEKGGLMSVDTSLFVSTLVLFALFALILAKFGWGPLLRMIDEREKGIREGVESAEKANAEAQALLAQHRELLREAGRERDEIIKRAQQEAEQLRSELSAKARAEAEALVQRAREQIRQETAQAVLELRSKVADIAVEAAAKIVKSSLSPEAQRKLVDEYIAALPRAQ
jgi:F-type H+-transporting ATPase subunit b